ncbi:unnamed protein product [Mycena citricolor]|uniref:Uncharacterized protein n=1 Tax=Mycena citricolor TaxID=2018698 RepID=A0AAD2JXA9_9AGAR|nr:unnamed protein product [Mycena citricolor]
MRWVRAPPGVPRDLPPRSGWSVYQGPPTRPDSHHIIHFGILDANAKLTMTPTTRRIYLSAFERLKCFQSYAPLADGSPSSSSPCDSHLRALCQTEYQSRSSSSLAVIRSNASSRLGFFRGPRVHRNSEQKSITVSPRR